MSAIICPYCSTQFSGVQCPGCESKDGIPTYRVPLATLTDPRPRPVGCRAVAGCGKPVVGYRKYDNNPCCEEHFTAAGQLGLGPVRYGPHEFYCESKDSRGSGSCICVSDAEFAESQVAQLQALYEPHRGQR